ncbi:DUF4198 domain-containing protein [Herminiimonas fonticola]|nr:DUF4198 domain-containing protein [Herminiimonas fonticola]
MKNFIKPLLATACCAALLVSSVAQAHYLWLESGKTDASLYYGEVDVQLREKSPGKLDRISGLQAFVPNGSDVKSVNVNRTATHLGIASGKASTVLALEESLAVADLTKHNLGMAKSNYYARLGQPLASGTTSPLVLDIAQGSKANSFVLLYRGQPLKNAKLEVIAPNTWMQEHHTNEQGIVEINTPWRGQYVMHVLHIDKTAGEFAGKPYDNLRNHLTYTFVKSKGANAGPVQPPKHPMD